MSTKILKTYLFVFMCLSTAAHAQFEFVSDNTGKPLTDKKYENLTGTPYLFDIWLKGEVNFDKGNKVIHEAIKYDMVTNKLLFEENNKVFEFKPRPKSFKVYAPKGEETFYLMADEKMGYFQLIADGKIKLFKKITKIILESKGYNSANTEKVVDENKKYFLVYNDIQSEVKLTKKSLLEKLPDFKDKIEVLDFTSNKQNAENVFRNNIIALNVK